MNGLEKNCSNTGEKLISPAKFARVVLPDAITPVIQL
jgi:hypothetical protein